MTVLERIEGPGESGAPGGGVAAGVREPELHDVLDALPGRVLDTRELRTLVDSLAARPDLWRDEVDFPEDRRHYASLHRDEHVDVWLLCWTPTSDTGFHDHDVSSGAVHVVKGAVAEHCLRLASTVRSTIAGDGSYTQTDTAAVLRF